MFTITKGNPNTNLVHTVHTEAENAAISKAHVSNISGTAKPIGRSDRGDSTPPKRGKGGKMGKEWE